MPINTMTDKMLRDRLYARQRKLLAQHLLLTQRLGCESICIPGMLLAVNPDLLSGKWPMFISSTSSEAPKMHKPQTTTLHVEQSNAKS